MLTLAAKPVVETQKARIREGIQQVSRRLGRAPHLSVVIVGDDPASHVYVTQKGKMAVELGMTHETVRFPASATPEEVRASVQALNADPKVDGILIQRPLPKAFKEDEVVYWVSPEKDVDAFHPENTGRLQLGLPCFQPCTPAGIMELLRHYGIDPSGKVACVIGRSSIVGKPMAALLLQSNATLIQGHSRTPNLPALCRQADLVIAAVGKPRIVTADFIKPGAVVVDVGINRGADGKLVGDVDFEAVSRVASAATPVPGGVGPMTIVTLMANTLHSALARAANTP